MPKSKHKRKGKRRPRTSELAKNSKGGPDTDMRRGDYASHANRPGPLVNDEFVCQTPIYISQLPNGLYRLESSDNFHHPEMKHLDGFEFTPKHGPELSDAMYLEIAKSHIPLNTLDECSDAGHPRQAWALLSFQQPTTEAKVCSICGNKPDFPSRGATLSVRGFMDDIVDEELRDGRFIEHAVVESVEDGNLFFRFASQVS